MEAANLSGISDKDQDVCLLFYPFVSSSFLCIRVRVRLLNPCSCQLLSLSLSLSLSPETYREPIILQRGGAHASYFR